MTDNKQHKKFEAGNTRVIVCVDETAPHPFLLADMSSSLACWGDEYGSFLPDAWNEGTQKRLKKQYQLIESIDDMKTWIDNAKNSHRPYLVYGITHFDKYGGLVLHKDEVHQDTLEQYDGTIFIDEKRFRKYVDIETQMSDVTMTGLMSNVLQAEFDQLNAWASFCMFGFILEKKCPTCGQWAVQDSVWGFSCLTPDDSAMLKEMAEHIDGEKDKEIAKIKKLMAG